MNKSVTIVSSKGLMHPSSYGGLLSKGLKHFGYDVFMVDTQDLSKLQGDIIACWGWRIGARLRANGKNVLVMERGYIGDRKKWTALAWNGLNNRAKWPGPTEENIASNRLEQHFPGLTSEKLREFGDGRYIILVGQVPGDMSLDGKDLRGFYRAKADELWSKFQMPIMLRPHPLDKRKYEDQWAGLQHVHAINTGDLGIAFSGAAGVVCFNSNTAVDAALAGLPTEVNDDGSMVYKLFRKALSKAPRQETEDAARRQRLQEITWRQWSAEELTAGLPWEIFGTPHEQLEKIYAAK